MSLGEEGIETWTGISLVVQWLRLRLPMLGCAGWGVKIPHSSGPENEM